MFNIGPGELVAILAVALIVLGPNRLPEAVRTVGRVVGELRRISSGFQEELRSALDDSDVIDRLETGDGADAAKSTKPTTATIDAPEVDTAAAALSGPLPSTKSDAGYEEDEEDNEDDEAVADVDRDEPPDTDDQRAAS